jgi:hypothetical protein
MIHTVPAVLVSMSVEALVAEGALTHSLVEVLALLQSQVFLNKSTQ